MSARAGPTSAEISRSFAADDAAAGHGKATRTLITLGPRLAVTAAAIGSLFVYAVLAQAVGSPRIFIDELVYWDAATSLARGDGLRIRGEPYPYGALYPTLLAGILWVFPNREVAYELAKTLNALLFALTAVPVYLLARRVLAPWASAGVAALSVAIPSSMYVSVVMTESLAYLAAAWATYAIVLALERPTFVTQGAAIAAAFLAYTARPQLGVLYAAYLLGLGLTWFLVPRRSARWRDGLLVLWPTALSLGAAVAALVVVPLLRGESLNELGGYEGLLRSYDPVAVADWLVYHFANLELYLAVVPFAVAPIVLASFVRRAREGSRRHAAFVALFVSGNAAVLFVAAVVNTTDSTHGRLHDRYTFYLVPLWLILLFAWIQDGARRPRVAAAFGAGAALLLPTLIPFSEYAREDGAQRFAGVASTLWAAIETATLEFPYVSGRAILFAFVVGLVTAALILPRRLAGATVAAVVLTFVITGQLAWYLAIRDGTNWAFADTPAGRLWVDKSVPPGSVVTSFSIAGRCESGLVGGDGFHRTEFFNESVTRAATVGPSQTQLPTTGVRMTPHGALLLPSGAPLSSDYVLALEGVLIDGRRVSTGTTSRLTLWDVGGPVRVLGIGARGRFEDKSCRTASS